MNYIITMCHLFDPRAICRGPATKPSADFPTPAKSRSLWWTSNWRTGSVAAVLGDDSGRHLPNSLNDSQVKKKFPGPRASLARRPFPWLAGVIGCSLGLTAPAGFSQEAVRASLAGEAAAAAKRTAANTAGYYNIKLGDLRIRLNSSATTEATDNVNLSDRNQQSDVILRPQAGGTFFYPVTERNALNLTVGAGYSFYLNRSDLNRYFITPGSEFSFDLFVGDCLLNLHDRFSVSQEATQNPAAPGGNNIGTFNNSTGISAQWDLHDLILSAGYDYALARSTTAGFDQQDSTTHAVHASSGFRLNSFSVLSLDLGTSVIERKIQNGGRQYNAGLSYRSQLTEYLSVRAATGYNLTQLDAPPLAGGQRNLDAFYGSLGVQHRVNRIVSYSLEAGRDIQIGFSSDVLDLYFARLQASWNLIRKISLSTQLSYEWGQETGGAGDKLTRYGGGLGLGRALTEKLGASLSYNFLNRISDTPGRDYWENRVTLSLTYAF